MDGALIKKVDCIRLFVDDLEAGLSFYRDKLGLRLIWRTEQEIGLGLPDDETEIVIQTQRKNPEIDLKVDSVDQAVDQIADAGGKVVQEPFDIKIGRCLVFKDPWDNELILLDSTKGLLKTDANGNVIGNIA